MTSDEDIWAVKTLNLVGAVDSLLKVKIVVENLYVSLTNALTK